MLIVPHTLYCVDYCLFCILPLLTVWHTVLVTVFPPPPHSHPYSLSFLFRYGFLAKIHYLKRPMLCLIRGEALRGGKGGNFSSLWWHFFNIHFIDIFTTYCHFTRRGTLDLRPFICNKCKLVACTMKWWKNFQMLMTYMTLRHVS